MTTTLRKRLLFVPLLPLLLWAVVVLLATHQSNTLETTAQEFSDHDLGLFRQLNGLYVSIVEGHLHIFSLLEQARNTQSQTAEDIYERMTRQVDKLDSIGEELDQLNLKALGIPGDEQTRMLTEIHHDYINYRTKVVQALRLASVDFSGAYRVMARSDSEFKKLSQKIAGMLKVIEGKFVNNFTQLESSFQASTSAIIILATILSIVIAASCILIYKRLSQGIQETLDLSDAITLGTLSTLPDQYKADELGHLAKSIHRMGTKLEDLQKNLEHKVNIRTDELRRMANRLEQEVIFRKQAAEDMKRLAETDDLTGLYNRRFFIDRIQREWQYERRKGHQLSLLLLDIDHFKHINDQYGHQMGDTCLKCLADTLHQCAKRITDTVARFGGEEFIVYLPDTSLDDAKALARHILEQVAAIELSPVTDDRPLTVSIGISCLSDSLPTPELVIRAADHAMYAAKHAGRNTFRIATEMPVGTYPSSEQD